MNPGQKGNNDGPYPPPNGQDGNNNSSHLPYNNRSQNGTFNANLNYPFQMQPYFPQQAYLQQGMQNYEDNFNPAALQHNQFAFNPVGVGTDLNQQQFSPLNSPMMQRPDTPSKSASQPRSDLPPRAMELKRQLKAMAHRNNSATPPSNHTAPNSAPNSASNTSIHSEAPTSVGGGASGFSTHYQPDDTDVDNLLKEARHGADSGMNVGMAMGSPVKIKKEKANMDSDRQAIKTPIQKAGTMMPSGSRGNAQNSTGNAHKSSRDTEDRSNEQNSDMSDGEIVEDPSPRRPLPPTGPKESELSIVKRKLADDQTARERRDDQFMKQSEKKEFHSPTNLHRSPVVSSSHPAATKFRDEKNDSSDSRPNSRRPYQEDRSYERTEQKKNERREERDPVRVEKAREDRGKYGATNPGSSPRNDREKSKSVPLLDRVLDQDDSLRTWLNLTGYNNHEDREKKLKKDYVAPSPALQEVLDSNDDLRGWLIITRYHEAEEREKKIKLFNQYLETEAALEKIKAALGGSTQGSDSTGAMLPPPTPTKVNDKNAAALQDSISRSMKIHSSSLNSNELAVNRKRRHDDEDGRELSEKYQKLETEGRGRITKTEGSSEHHPDARRRSLTGSESGKHYKHEDISPDHRRRSVSPRYKQSDSRDSGRVYAEYGRGRGYSHQDHEMNNHRIYENRPAGGSFIRDRSSMGKVDDSDWKTRRLNESLEPERAERSDGRGYRGKAYDPHYHENRGRGVSRGRGRGRGYSMDVSDAPSPRTYGSKSGPNGHREAWDRGDKGDTRFFIMKSFNEENVLLCQRDGIWMTQEHNSPILAEAYQNCKNVILCYSINMSKGFQGYARMESLPGTADLPPWAKNIHWKSPGAFRVRWLTIANTHFQRVGHLKNSLNEEMNVYVGKDGQEIEEEAGRQLVNIIDEEYDYKYKNSQQHEGSSGSDGAGGVGRGSMSKYVRGGGGGDGGGGGGGGGGMARGRGDGRGYRTYRLPGSDVGEIRGW